MALFVSLCALAACQSDNQETNKQSKTPLKIGVWQGTLSLQGQEAPFQFEIKEAGSDSLVVFLINGAERLRLDEVQKSGDSLIITLHTFDAVLATKIISKTELTGKWIKYGYNQPYEVPFRAVFGKERFEPAEKPSKADFSGKWAVNFKNSKGDSYPAIGVFEQLANKVTGTFLTTTGDYRFLEGVVRQDTLHLTAFDGGHGFLFKAVLQGDSLKGNFWAGMLGLEEFSGYRNEKAELADANTLTFLKEGYKGIEFAFPNVKNDTLFFPSKSYEGKVVMIQILGTWCPNCMDETEFYLPFYQKNKHRGLEIIGLSYERSPDFKEAAKRVKKMIEKYDITYEVLVAGILDKAEASKTLPMLNRVISYPTTIFIDRKGKVRKIHTGFSGPGTGSYYEKYTNEFYQFTEMLLNEQP